MSKKRIFGITLFIILGLVMFTFANPNEDEGKKLDEDNQTELQPTDEQPEPEIDNVIQDEDETNIIPVTTTPDNQQDNDTITDEDSEVNEGVTEDEENTPVEDEEANTENENLDEYKQNKKVEINEYEASLKLDDKDVAQSLINKNNEKIDDATTKEEIDDVVEETKKALDELKAKENLEKLKQEKIEEIKNYKKDYVYNNENQDKYNDLIDSIIKNINDGITEEEVIEAFNNGKEAVDALINEDLDAYRQLKYKELVEYKEQINWNDFYEILANIVLNDAKKSINEAETKELIDTLVEEAKEKLDSLKNNQMIDEYKEIKKQEMTDYNSQELYSEENQKLVDEIKELAKELISNANDVDEIDQIVSENKEKIDEIQKLTETKFAVTFIDFNNKVIKTEEVMYGGSATAPSVKDVTSKSIVYSFDKWDKDFNEIKSELTVKAVYKVVKIYANIYALNEGLQQPEGQTKYSTKDYTKIGSIELKITNELLSVIEKGKTVNVTTDEQEIKNMVIGTLPELEKQNYKYNYYVLKFEKGDGFHIDASQVIDEEELAKNTVTITYQLDESLSDCVMENNQTTITSTVTTGENIITKLPKVYKDGKEYAVVWKDSDGNVISKINVGSVSLNTDQKIYTKSTIITATMDKVGPTLELKGDANIEVEYSLTDDYVEPGYYAVDNFDGDVTDKVVTTITYNNIETNMISYDIPGTYVIKYTVVDSQGNKMVKTRTITVVDPIKEIKAGVYLLNDDITRPSADTRLSSSNYTKIGEVNLVIDKVRKYIDGDVQVISTDDIMSYIIGGEKSLPSMDSKYYYYEYYVLKYEKDGFHIDCEKMFDSELYKSDKLKELKDLLEDDYTKYESEKTFDTYTKLVDVINNYKDKEFDNIDDIEQAIMDIKNAINGLEDIKLVKLTLSNNNDEYFINQQMKPIVVTAIYNDATRNKVLTTDDYVMSEVFNSQVVGKKAIVYTYENKSITYNYTVNYSNSDLHNIVSNVNINLEIKIDFEQFSHNKTYFMNFNDLDSEISVVSVEVKKRDKVLRAIDLSQKVNNSFVLSVDDYNQLKNNNTMVSGKVIVITYMINNQYVSVEYYEAMNNLYMM